MIDAKCDFCGLPPAWLFPTRGFLLTVDQVPITDSKGWAACDRCALFFETRNWDELVKRSVDFVVKRKGGDPIPLYPFLHKVFNLVDANRVGPKQSWSDYVSGS